MVKQDGTWRQAQYTLDQLAQYDGKNGRPAYVAVNNVIYNVTGSTQWQGGIHFGLVAGKDLSSDFANCHQGNEEILNELPKVGVLVAERTEMNSINSGICSGYNGKQELVRQLVNEAVNHKGPKVNLIWLEATACSGNIISFLNALNPGVEQLLREKINFCFNNSLMVSEGEKAMKMLFDTANGEFILVVEGAVATKDEGLFTVIGRYRGEKITAMKAVQYLGERAAHVIAVGTCASYGGPSAARPNPGQCISVVDALKRKVIRVPGCPCHPDWFIGTLTHILLYGEPVLDNENRPVLFYGITIHDNCTRRSYFDKGIFATKLGEETCMFKLGCRGPRTKTDCPTRQWNGYVNWPVKANTPCIGCAHPTFPDGTEPFVTYEKGGEE